MNVLIMIYVVMETYVLVIAFAIYAEYVKNLILSRKLARRKSLMPFGYNKTEPEYCLGCGRKLTAAERAEGVCERCGGNRLNNKELFANTISELEKHAVPGITVCEKYGMTWGCDENCPVLNEGKCEHWVSVDEFVEDMGR